MVLAKAPGFTLVIESFRALMAIVRLVVVFKKRVSEATAGDLQREHDELAKAVRRHLERFAAAYTEEEVHPKHHMMFHLPRQHLRDGRLIDCFVHERKHRAVKNEARHLDTQSRWERYAMARVLADQALNLAGPT